MAVLVLGGYGLIGSAIVGRLRAEGVPVIGLGRDVSTARRRRPDVEWRQTDLRRLTTPDAWDPWLADIDVVVNAAGVLQAGLGDDPAAVQQAAMTVLYAKARDVGIRRIVQISAVGAALGASTDFLRTKAAADAALLASGVDAVILRPGLVIAPVAYGGTSLLRALAATPMALPLVHAQASIQVVSVDDVAAVAVQAVSGDIPAGAALDLVEPNSRSLAETVMMFRAWLGLPPAPVLALPAPVAVASARVADLLGWLGWRSPLRSTAMASIRDGVTGDPAQMAALICRQLDDLPTILRALPSGPQERWFARMWLAKPLVFAVLSAFWIASGAIGLLERDAAAAVLTTRGAASAFAMSAVWAGGLADILLGVSVLVRPIAGWALIGMLLVSFGYLTGASIWAPDLWLDPLGPMVKVVPAMALALVALAVLEAR